MKAKPKKVLLESEAIDCSLILVDLSGFTQMVYQASYNEAVFQKVALAMKLLFQDAVRAAAAVEELRIITTTGDGFYAIVAGPRPSRTAVRFAQEIQAHFDRSVKPVIRSVPFRQRVDLRIALHHDVVHRVGIDGLGAGDQSIYLGDGLNLVSRVINSQVARRYSIAITRSFYRRLMMTKGDPPTPDEVILDRNRYPEPIEIYRLPMEIPDLDRVKRKR